MFFKQEITVVNDCVSGTHCWEEVLQVLFTVRTYFFTSNCMRVILTYSQEASLFPVAQFYCMSDYDLDEVDWVNLQKKTLSETIQLNGWISQYRARYRRTNAAIVTDNRKWHKTNLTLTGSCFFWQHKKENMWKLLQCSLQHVLPPQFPALPCPKLWPVFVLSLHV